MILARKARSAAYRPGDCETFFQHLEADNLSVGTGEHYRGVRLDDLACSNCRKAFHFGQVFKAISTMRSSALRVAPVDA
jgi:hypothetical protein